MSSNGADSTGDLQQDRKRYEKTVKGMFINAMSGRWQEVAEIYAKEESVREATIAQTGDTVLHLAVSSSEESNVNPLLGSIVQERSREILGMENERGDTPLHLAAALGMEEACRVMSNRCPQLLVEARNKQGETPLFKAARHGQMKAFRAIQYVIEDRLNITEEGPRNLEYCRKLGGDTILHVALFGEHYELALEIIERYGELANYYNEKGESPLHILANKPSAFKSGAHFSPLESLIYNCMSAVPLHLNYWQKQNKNSPTAEVGAQKISHNFLSLVKGKFWSIVHRFRHRPDLTRSITGDVDAEDPRNPVLESGGVDQVRRKNLEIKTRSFHNSYTALFGWFGPVKRFLPHIKWFGPARRFLPHIKWLELTRRFLLSIKWFEPMEKFLLHIIKNVIGHGINFIKIMEQRRTHVHAFQIMEKLLEHCHDWDFGKAGKDPSKIKSEWLKLTPSELIVEHLAPEIEQENEKEAKGEVKNEPEQSAPPKKGPDGECYTIEEDSSTMGGWIRGSSLGPHPLLRSINELLKSVRSSLVVHHVSKGANQAVNIFPATPLLVAAKNGIEELVESILNRFPIALLDLDSDEKNILLLAVEYRQSNIYELLLKRKEMQQSVFGMVDKEGNSAFHLAAKLGPIPPEIIPGAALRMQWEVKWYKYVERSMDPNFFPRYNHKRESARDVFTKTHEALVKEGGDWLTKTSKSCSVVAALIATVAFATASSLPGGVNQNTGFPVFQGQLGFHVFAISALVALCFSVTSLVMFLSFLTSRYDQWYFETHLPLKLIFNLTSLFLSIAAMLISFCAGHFFVINNQFKQAVNSLPLYAVVCLPVFLFAMAQFPLYVSLIRATFARVPERAVSGPWFYNSSFLICLFEG